VPDPREENRQIHNREGLGVIYVPPPAGTSVRYRPQSRNGSLTPPLSTGGLQVFLDVLVEGRSDNIRVVLHPLLMPERADLRLSGVVWRETGRLKLPSNFTLARGERHRNVVPDEHGARVVTVDVDDVTTLRLSNVIKVTCGGFCSAPVGVH
jgi:hypothetical protein